MNDFGIHPVVSFIAGMIVYAAFILHISYIVFFVFDTIWEIISCQEFCRKSNKFMNKFLFLLLLIFALFWVIYITNLTLAMPISNDGLRFAIKLLAMVTVLLLLSLGRHAFEVSRGTKLPKKQEDSLYGIILSFLGVVFPVYAEAFSDNSAEKKAALFFGISALTALVLMVLFYFELICDYEKTKNHNHFEGKDDEPRNS